MKILPENITMIHVVSDWAHARKDSEQCVMSETLIYPPTDHFSLRAMAILFLHIAWHAEVPTSNLQTLPMIPLPTPSSLMRSDFEHIRSHQYLIAPKNDGVRALLLIILKNGHETICVSIHRNGHVQDLSERITFPLHHNIEGGSILDGEWMTHPDGSEEFVVFDAIAALGLSMRTALFSLRLVMAHACVRVLTTPPGLKISVKKFIDPKESPDEARNLLMSVLDSNGVDGLILAPMTDSIEAGRQHHYFKYKPLSVITIDLKWDPLMKVLTCDDRSDGGDAELLVESAMPGITWIEQDFADCCGGLWECFVRVVRRSEDRTPLFQITPKCLRTDKTRANSPFVIRRTCQNINENISVVDLLNLFGLTETNADPVGHEFVAPPDSDVGHGPPVSVDR